MTFGVAIPPALQTAASGWRALPFFEAASGLSRRGGSSGERASRQKAREADAKPTGAPRPARPPRRNPATRDPQALQAPRPTSARVGSQVVVESAPQPQPQPPLREPRAHSGAPPAPTAAGLQLRGPLLPGTPAPAPRTSVPAELPLGFPTATAPQVRPGFLRFRRHNNKEVSPQACERRNALGK